MFAQDILSNGVPKLKKSGEDLLDKRHSQVLTCVQRMDPLSSIHFGSF